MAFHYGFLVWLVVMIFRLCEESEPSQPINLFLEVKVRVVLQCLENHSSLLHFQAIQIGLG